MSDLVIAGAGMAGLVAAATASELGADVVVQEKGPRPGGSMLLSSGVIWRHASFEAFREECPDGDPVLQRLVWEGLPEGLAWLEALGARVVERETGNPRTEGARFDTRSLTSALACRAGRLRLDQAVRALPEKLPVVLATGGFAANRDLVREHITPEADSLLLRATSWSTGDGLALGLEAGGRVSSRLDELYGRNMPAAPVGIDESRFVPLAQLYAHHAVVRSGDGRTFESRTWSEIDVVQWTAKQPGARARYEIDLRNLGLEAAGGRTIGELVAAAAGVGAPVSRGRETVSVDVIAGITTTLGGLAVDEHARVAPGIYAAGGDVGGIANGGYSSGLAAALVLGRLAARSALGVQ
jgi:fumarate reductase flavoprotein subunit